MRSSTVYVSSNADYERHQQRLKHTACPHCRAVGTLIRHGYLRGYGDAPVGTMAHGWRVFCSNRGRQTDCGRTYAIVLACHLYRRLVDARRLWKFLEGVWGGASIKHAWEAVASPFCLETGYKLWAAFIRNQSVIRVKLHAIAKPVATALDPLIQTIAHVKAGFPQADCPVAAFQTAFQAAFLAR